MLPVTGDQLSTAVTGHTLTLLFEKLESNVTDYLTRYLNHLTLI